MMLREERQEESPLVPFVLLSLKDWGVKPCYADLFFRVVDIERDDKERIVSFSGKCLLCGKVISPFASNNQESGRKRWQRYRFSEHLTKIHGCKGSPMKKFSSWDDLKDIKKVTDEVQHTGITSFFGKREARNGEEGASKRMKTGCSDDSEEITALKTVESIGAGSGYVVVLKGQVMRTVKVTVGNMADSWNRRDDVTCLFWKDDIATYDQSNRVIPVIYNNLRVLLQCLLQCFSAYSLSCDAWSLPSVGFKAICFFIHVYHQRTYRTLLLDVIPVDGGKAEDIDNAAKRVGKYYHLSEDWLITTDGAFANVRCFGTRRLICIAHALNTACSHLVSPARDSRACNLDKDERSIIREYFGAADNICKIFRSDATYKEFVEWYDNYVQSRPDVDKANLKKPLTPCETRWIGKIIFLEWLQECGVAAYAFLAYEGRKGVDLEVVHDCLRQLPEVYGLLRIMNNALNLLAGETTTAHLILPVLYWLKRIFTSLHGRLHSKVAQLMLKSFLWELTDGCLVIPTEQLKYYRCAAACHPFLEKTTPELFEECMKEAEEQYAKILSACSEEQRRSLSESRTSFSKYIKSVLDDVKNSEMLTIDAIPNALKHHPKGIDGLRLRGDTGGLLSVEALNALVIRSKESVEKELKRLERSLKSYRKQNCDPSNIISRIRMLENWKLYGGSVDDEKTPATGEEAAYDTAVLLCMVSTTKVQHLFDFYEKDGSEAKPASDPITLMYENSLHISATEADCERFFRILSLVVKKPYVVNVGKEKACMKAFIRYYAREVYYAMGNGKEEKKSIYSIMFKQGRLRVC